MATQPKRPVKRAARRAARRAAKAEGREKIYRAVETIAGGPRPAGAKSALQKLKDKTPMRNAAIDKLTGGRPAGKGDALFN